MHAAFAIALYISAMHIHMYTEPTSFSTKHMHDQSQYRPVELHWQLVRYRFMRAHMSQDDDIGLNIDSFEFEFSLVAMHFMCS